MQLSIVIVNYKTKGLLKQCLRGILDCQLTLKHEVIVIDNYSNDGSADMVRDNFPSVHIVAAEQNGGFAVGANLGLRQAKGQYILVLNTDIAIFHGAAESLCRYLDQHPQVGIAVPKLINPDGSTQLSVQRFPSFWIPIWRRTPLGKLPQPRLVVERYLMTDWDHASDGPVGWALGGCMMIRKEAFQAVGFFDERFFLYVEDVDYCRRMWSRGWEVHYVAGTEMVHYHQRLSAEQPAWIGLFAYPARMHIKSWIRYFAKYNGAPKPPHSL